ncbi:hypothetical protein J6590_034283 [Homalodisca vitripennis]|nr:hypothetical protein J6590_034283 [Homalodisca vitripennis]
MPRLHEPRFRAESQPCYLLRLATSTTLPSITINHSPSHYPPSLSSATPPSITIIPTPTATLSITIIASSTTPPSITTNTTLHHITLHHYHTTLHYTTLHHHQPPSITIINPPPHHPPSPSHHTPSQPTINLGFLPAYNDRRKHGRKWSSKSFNYHLP